MAKLNKEWKDTFRNTFENEEDIIDFIFERLDISDFKDSYIDVGGYREPNEMFKETKEDKKELLYDFMISLIEDKEVIKIQLQESLIYNFFDGRYYITFYSQEEILNFLKFIHQYDNRYNSNFSLSNKIKSVSWDYSKSLNRHQLEWSDKIDYFYKSNIDKKELPYYIIKEYIDKFNLTLKTI